MIKVELFDLWGQLLIDLLIDQPSSKLPSLIIYAERFFVYRDGFAYVEAVPLRVIAD